MTLTKAIAPQITLLDFGKGDRTQITLLDFGKGDRTQITLHDFDKGDRTTHNYVFKRKGTLRFYGGQFFARKV